LRQGRAVVNRSKESQMRDISVERILPRRSAFATLFGVLITVMRRLGRWRGACSERSRQRRILASLPDHGLRDIGLTRADVESEIAKPCWRP
jgi:uncharacterized protein YjiS (DUF1127 family)